LRCLYSLVSIPPLSARTATLSLHDALPISLPGAQQRPDRAQGATAAARLAVRARARRVDRGRDLHQLPAAQAGRAGPAGHHHPRSEEHTSELQSRENLVCRLLLEKKKT